MTLDDLTPEAAMLENLRSVPMPAFQREATKAALGLAVVFRRERLYLNERYQWGNIPHAFPIWQADGVQAIIHKMPDPPTHYAEVRSGEDLDEADWREV